MEQLDKALQSFRQVIALELNHEEAHYRLGYLYIMMGEEEKARKESHFLRHIKSPFHQSLELLLRS
jgi:lipopolysaccharide biosynthesis regulator YciM